MLADSKAQRAAADEATAKLAQREREFLAWVENKEKQSRPRQWPAESVRRPSEPRERSEQGQSPVRFHDRVDDEEAGSLDLTGEYDPIIDPKTALRLSDAIEQFAAQEKIRALPAPVPGGSVQALRSFLNVRFDADLCWWWPGRWRACATSAHEEASS